MGVWRGRVRAGGGGLSYRHQQTRTKYNRGWGRECCCARRWASRGVGAADSLMLDISGGVRGPRVHPGYILACRSHTNSDAERTPDDTSPVRALFMCVSQTVWDWKIFKHFVQSVPLGRLLCHCFALMLNTVVSKSNGSSMCLAFSTEKF